MARKRTIGDASRFAGRSKIVWDAARSGSRLPLSQWVQECGGSVGLVSVDIVSSPLAPTKLGNVPYEEVRIACLNRVNRKARSLDGRSVPVDGTSLLYAFPTAVSAYIFAAQLFWRSDPDSRRFRIGVHSGPVIVDDDTLSGEAIQYAECVMRHGVGSELWVSQVVRDEVEADLPQPTTSERIEKILGYPASCRWLTNEEQAFDGIPGEQVLWRAG